MFVVTAPIPGMDLDASHAAPAAPPVASLTFPAKDLIDLAVSPIFRRAPLPVVDMNRPTSLAFLFAVSRRPILNIGETLIFRLFVLKDMVLHDTGWVATATLTDWRFGERSDIDEISLEEAKWFAESVGLGQFIK